MTFEDQIAQISGKEHLRKWIDDLPESTIGVLIIQVDDPDEGTYYKFAKLGDISEPHMVYLCKSFEHYHFSDIHEGRRSGKSA